MVDSNADWLWRQFSLDGKRVLVTGASRGIGRALAVGCARAGAELVVAARQMAALEETANCIRDIGGVVECITCDQADVGSVRDSLAGLGHLDVLINNAGVEEVCPSLDVSETLWSKIVDTNLKGAFFVAQTVAAGMVERGDGAIVNLASLTSFVGVPTAAPYGASKSGILGMTRALAAEWGPQGVRVNALAPGYFHTAMTDTFYEDAGWVANMTNNMPLRRLGRLDDLVGAAIFLAAPASRYITGHCLVVDGGYLASI